MFFWERSKKKFRSTEGNEGAEKNFAALPGSSSVVRLTQTLWNLTVAASRRSSAS